MHPYSRRQLEEMLDLLDRLDANGIISKGKGSREAFDLQVRQLYGYARDHAQVLEGIGGKITDLNQILNQEVISKCVRWG